MKVSGFSYVRNGFEYYYPFLEAIQSILPLCDEFIAVVGDSKDGTREAIEKMQNPKIKIVDTIWDNNLREGGYIFSQQANIGLDHCTGDWCFHIQADEVIHEDDLPTIKKAMEDHLADSRIDGLLFHFINFFGDYQHFGPSRKFHNKEIRIVRNNPAVRSYRDSMGFRLFKDPRHYLTEKGKKLLVKQIAATIFHYSYVKPPDQQLKKQQVFGNRYKKNSSWFDEYVKQHPAGYNYNQVDVLDIFTGSHPAVMKRHIGGQNWEFKYDPSKNSMDLKDRILFFIERKTGRRLFTYKNYRII